MSNVPSDLKYAKSHEWVRIEGDTEFVAQIQEWLKYFREGWMYRETTAKAKS